MYVALVVEVLNNGHKSCCKAFRVTAKTYYGAVIPVEVFGNAFRLVVNSGRDCFDFLPEHYIMNRTFPDVVERGKSVTGILPCVFRGIKNAKDVDARTIKVEFADVIGDADGNGKWWASGEIEGVQWEDPIPVKHRSNLPVLQQPCGNTGLQIAAPSSQQASIQELSYIANLIRITKALEVKVQILINAMEEEMSSHGSLASGDANAKFRKLLSSSRDRYDEEIEPDLIKLAIDLRTKYGIMPSD